MSHHVAVSEAAKLFQAAYAIASSTLDVAERRLKLLSALAVLIAADIGHWAWGRGFPGRNEVTPVAALDYGLAPSQKTLMMQLGMDRDADRSFRERVVTRLEGKSQVASTRTDVMTTQEWHESKMFCSYVSAMNLDSFVHCVRYPAADTWCHLLFFRNLGRVEFGDREAALLDLALAGIPWLTPQVPETVPPQAFGGLTPQQRVVLMMQLDGLSRKQIAANLQVTEQTVGDHLKALYKHFGVHSASELAARFLRGA